MFLQLLQIEFRYQFRHYFFLVGCLIFIFLGWMMVGQAHGINYNSPYQIAFHSSLITLGSVFVIMFFTVSGLLRDKLYHTEGIIFSTQLTKSAFFTSRFLGIGIGSLFVCSMFVLGLMVGLWTRQLNPELIGDFDVWVYVWNWLLFIVPNVFFCSVLIFCMGIFSKNNLAIYGSAVFVYALYWLVSIFLGSPLLANASPVSAEQMQFMAILDPFAISSFFEQSSFWTTHEKNTLLLSLSGSLLLNRLFWLACSIFILVFTYRLFKFQPTISTASLLKKQTSISTKKENVTFPKWSQIPSLFPASKTTQWQSYLIQTKIYFRLIIRSLPFLAIFLIWTIIILTEGYNDLTRSGQYSESLYAFSFLLVKVIASPIKFLLILLLGFFSSELIWKEQETKFTQLLDASPIRVSTLFGARLTVLLMLPLVLITSGIFYGIVLQLLKGFPKIDIGMYLSLFYHQGMISFFYAMLGLFLQMLLRNKYLAMAIFFVFALLLGSFLANSIGIEHPLLQIGRFPSISYSDMSHFASSSSRFVYMSLHWFSLAIVLMLLSFSMSKRGIDNRRSILKNFQQQSNFYKIVFGVSIILHSFSIFFIFYQLNIQTTYLNTNDVFSLRETYERNYKSLAQQGRLFPTKIDIEVVIFPNAPSYEVKAVYVLKNKNNLPLDTLLISEKEELFALEIPNAKLVERDSLLGVWVFAFAQPVLPQDQIQISYHLIKKVGLLESNKSVISNGTYINLRDFSPVFGYSEGYEIQDNREREKRKLPIKREESENEDDFFTEEAGYGRIDYHAIISTTATQKAITSGNLLKTWTENDRSYYEYQSPIPILPTVGFASAVYEVHTTQHKSITIENYYHSPHDFNIEEMIKSTKATLDYCQENYGNYPFDRISFVEIPSYWNFGGFAHPAMISMVENRLYLTDQRNENAFNLVAKRTIHEVAHQWWGHLLAPKNIQGGSLLVEGLAKYNEAVIMEKMIGKKALWQLSKTSSKQYFSGRSQEVNGEKPLYFAQGEPYLSYGKSYFSMLSLRELIGEDSLNLVLKNLVTKYRTQNEFEATSLEFLEAVYKVCPSAYHTLIDDWFKKLITYNLAIQSVSHERLIDGRYKIKIDLLAERFEHDAKGNSNSIPIQENILIGLFEEYPSQAQKEQISYLQPHFITDTTSSIELIVNKLPSYIGIDPFGNRLDKDIENNIYAID